MAKSKSTLRPAVSDADSNAANDRGVSLSDQAYSYIVQSLENGTMPPGTRLRETELAADIGLSRTPVREALNRLMSEGLVTNDPKRGLIITELDQNMVGELYEMRRVLESTAAALAARHATDVEIAVLRQIIDRDETLNDPAALSQNNRLFHQTLYQCAHNRYLLKTLQVLQNAMLLLGKSTLAESGRPSTAREEHQEIIGALEQRNPDQAQALASRHISEAYKVRLSRFLLDRN
ncbi:GntR family transcriptional regulator [Advenella kashmirensis]|uniref:GntR family transcriptional regulator n=1 Tax=Advenella kashmirensis TaxID=310575 RepID=UPI000403B0F0|nr:GntR family transcriptional regulator [Advenella kashmirensis]